MARRLLGRVVPVVTPRLALERREQRPRLRAVAALEQADALGADEHPAVGGRHVGHLRKLQAPVWIIEPLARVLPGLAKIGAAPDRGAMPLARRGVEDRPGVRVE